MVTLPILAIALILGRLVLFVHLHLAHREFSPLRNTVSDYGTGATRREYTLMSVLSLPAYALVLTACAVAAVGPAWALVAGWVGVLAGAAMLFFPTDLTGTKMTATGVAHWVLAVVQFAGLFVLMTNLAVPGGLSPVPFEVITWIVRVSFYAFLITLVIPRLRRTLIGLTERAFLTATPIWFLIVALYLIGPR
ncbi:DUF998 domain-containing protein [Microbacterium sp. 22242]|uniref:DUF998 domain-containing protein n=1 Tax=Microbacterium sp. 22242 TaxID=3453896 RepID=UPI003F8315BB